MASSQNSGKKLFFSQFGGEQPIPPEFIAAMDRKEEVQSVNNEVEPETLSDTIVESTVKTDRTNERVRRTIKKKAGNVGPLRFIHTNDQGRPVQASRLLYPTGSALSTIPNEYTTVAVQDLGNEWSIEEVGIEGSYTTGGPVPVFVPGLFPAAKYSRENPNVTPVEFRALIDVVTTRLDFAGTAVDPTLSGTEISESQEQVTAFKKRIEISTQDFPSLPAVLDKGRDTNQDKQDVVVTRTLATDATTAPIATALKDVQIKQLGDGNKVIETREVSAVASHQVFAKEIPDRTPEKFRPSVVTATTRVDASGTAINPTLGANELRATQEQITNLTKRTESVTRVNPSLPVVLSLSRDTNEYDQDVTITETLMSGVTTAQTATALRDVQVEDLGDARKVETLRDVAAVPGREVFERSRPNLTPEEFRAAIPTIVTQVESAGTAVDPTLSGTELEESQTQVTAKIKRIRIATQADPSVPVILDKGLDTNNDQQSVVVTRKLIADATAAASVSALQEVSVKQLGNGFKVQETREVASVATHNLFARSRPNLVPEKFRPSIPTVTTRQDTSGTAVDPTLAGTELEETQEQFTELKKRITIVTQAAPSLPIALGGKDTNSDKQVVTVVETLQSSVTTPTTPTALIDVKVENLGDGNVVQTTRTRPSVLDKTIFEARVPEFVPERFRQTSDVETTTIHEVTGTASAPSLSVVGGDLMKREEQLDTFVKRTTAVNRPNNNYPALDGHTYDAENDILLPYTESIQTAGANAATGNTEVTPLNDNLDLVKAIGRTAIRTALDAYNNIFSGSTNIDFPTELISIVGRQESLAGGAGGYNQAGNWAVTGHGTASMTLHGSAQGSAGAMLEVTYNVKQVWGSNVPCTHVLFFMVSNSTRATVLSRIGTLIGTAVTDWPQFVPRSETFICHGEKVAGNVLVDLHATDTVITDYNGAVIDLGQARTIGSGTSYDISVSTKTIRIPPTIHAALTLTGDTAKVVNFSAAGAISAGGGGSTGTAAIAGHADASVTPTSLAATLGQATIPTSGSYLYRLSAEPYKYGYVKFHAEIVKFNANGVIP